MKTFLSLLMMTLLSSTALAANDPAQAAMQQLQQRWAEIKYTLPQDQQEPAFKALAALANDDAERYPRSAELLIWRGIVLSTYAGAKGSLGALKLVGAARESLEQAMAIDDRALSGSAYTSLGALYYQVPGWPLSFGSDKQARKLLTKALEIDPDGIDSNYFYADFLISQDDFKQARRVLNHALEAPPRPGRELADQGRRREIETLIAKLKDKDA